MTTKSDLKIANGDDYIRVTRNGVTYGITNIQEIEEDADGDVDVLCASLTAKSGNIRFQLYEESRREHPEDGGEHLYDLYQLSIQMKDSERSKWFTAAETELSEREYNEIRTALEDMQDFINDGHAAPISVRNSPSGGEA